MIKKLCLTAILGAGAIIGCTPIMQSIPLRDMSEQEIKASNAVVMLNQAQLAGKKFSVLGSVEGISCKRNRHDPSATRSDALFQTRFWASKKNANAIANVRCVQNKDALEKGCLETYTCTADAIRLE